MITPKQWKEFNKYRDKIAAEVYASDEYLKALERDIRNDNPILGIVTGMMLEMEESKIPPKTVEACLDWLSNIAG